MEDVDTVSQGVIYSCPPSGRRSRGQPKPSDQKAPFIVAFRQVTQNPKHFFGNILKISFSCEQLGVFRTNIQWATYFVHNFAIANISRLALSLDHPFGQELLLHTGMTTLSVHNLLGEMVPPQQK